MQVTIHPRIASRRIRVGVFDTRTDSIIAKAIFPSGSDIVLGGRRGDGLFIPNWSGARQLLISQGYLLHVHPGMRIHVCHDNGEDRLAGEYDELVARGIPLPIPLTVSKLNIRVRDGLSVFAKYLADDEADWPDSGKWGEG